MVILSYVTAIRHTLGLFDTTDQLIILTCKSSAYEILFEPNNLYACLRIAVHHMSFLSKVLSHIPSMVQVFFFPDPANGPVFHGASIYSESLTRLCGSSS